MKKRNALGTLAVISSFDRPTWLMFWELLVNFLRTNIATTENAVPRSPVLKALASSFIEEGHGDQFWGMDITHHWKLSNMEDRRAIHSFLERCILTARATVNLHHVTSSPQAAGLEQPLRTFITSADQMDIDEALPAVRDRLPILANTLRQLNLDA